MKELIKSPLNFSGNKFKLLPQLLPLFPKNISTFVDVFDGSFTIGQNIDCDKIIYNELDSRIFNLVQYISTCDYNEEKIVLNGLIDQYQLGKNTKEEYVKLRIDYNNTQDSRLLFLLSCFSFNYQIRFNSKGEFNMPCGNRGFSKNMDEWFRKSNELCKNKDIKFINNSFNELIYTNKDDNLFFYCDPPYLQTIATYTENGAWNLDKEYEMYKLLDDLNEKGIKFGLSNTMWYHNEENLVLKEWSKKYKVVELDFNYTNNNRHKKDNDEKTVEVYICNY